MVSVPLPTYWILSVQLPHPVPVPLPDDFIILAPGDSPECAVSVAVAWEVFGRLGLPLDPDKCTGSTTCLVFLGIGLDLVLNSASSRDPASMHLLRRLSLMACRYHFSFSARYIPGRRNSAADALSRFRFQEFRRLLPSADRSPTPVPPRLILELLSSP